MIFIDTYIDRVKKKKGKLSHLLLSQTIFLPFFPIFFFTHIFIGMHNHIELTPILSIGIFIGILTALTCITIAIIVAIKLRSSHQQNTNAGKNSKSRPGNLQIKEKISVPLSQSEELYDEKNPDVIPSNEGKCVIINVGVCVCVYVDCVVLFIMIIYFCSFFRLLDNNQ